MIGVYLQTSRFKEPRYYNSITIKLPEATQDTRVITQYAIAAIKSLYQNGYEFAKCGILLLELSEETFFQGSLLQDGMQSNPKLMQTMDKINHKFGRKAVFLASEGTTKTWQMKRENRTPRYTTCWAELMIVHCQ